MSSTLLILASKLGYQTRAFAAAAAELALGITYGTDRCHVLEDPWGDQALPLHFEEPEASARQIEEYAHANPLAGIVALGDRATPTAARACAALGLPFHSVAAADTCRDKYRSRTALAQAGLSVPAFIRVPVDRDLAPVPFPLPWVLKPLSLSGSRGVIRANTAEQAKAAFKRIGAMLRSPEIQVLREDTANFIQIEQYVAGVEVAIEALVDRGQLKLLAVFDKPDSLTGPYFEETIYVTPSRLPARLQQQIEGTLRQAVEVLGLYHGPVHAEMRIKPGASADSAGAVCIMEVAARCIGGLCARSLRFKNQNIGSSEGPINVCLGQTPMDPITRFSNHLISLESLLVRLAIGQPVSCFAREKSASGVMMVPVPADGIYEGVAGLAEAERVPNVEDIEITAKPGQRLLRLPEGSSYLGFIFARAESPDAVEQSLRTAHAKLSFRVAPALPVISVH